MLNALSSHYRHLPDFSITIVNCSVISKIKIHRHLIWLPSRKNTHSLLAHDQRPNHVWIYGIGSIHNWTRSRSIVEKCPNTLHIRIWISIVCAQLFLLLALNLHLSPPRFNGSDPLSSRKTKNETKSCWKIGVTRVVCAILTNSHCVYIKPREWVSLFGLVKWLEPRQLSTLLNYNKRNDLFCSFPLLTSLDFPKCAIFHTYFSLLFPLLSSPITIARRRLCCVLLLMEQNKINNSTTLDCT